MAATGVQWLFHTGLLLTDISVMSDCYVMACMGSGGRAEWCCCHQEMTKQQLGLGRLCNISRRNYFCLKCMTDSLWMVPVKTEELEGSADVPLLDAGNRVLTRGDGVWCVGKAAAG